MTYALEKERFGYAAVKKGFITLDQFVTAIKIQVIDDVSGKGHRRIGEILVSLDYMNSAQVDDVLERTGSQKIACHA
jgi:hypothetical protein